MDKFIEANKKIAESGLSLEEALEANRRLTKLLAQQIIENNKLREQLNEKNKT